MQFIKYHGAGNDYVYVDCFRQALPDDPSALAPMISDRRRGVGSDGLILICPADGVDAEMRMFNADGSYSAMCGNGIRCVAKYLYDYGIVPRTTLRVASGGAIYQLQLVLSGGVVDEVCVDMGAPVLEAEQIPTLLPGDPPLLASMAVGDWRLEVTCVSMGNPHCVVFVEQANDRLVAEAGPQIEKSQLFPERTNVEFVEVRDRRRVFQRTWERGSGETLACGTGACATCVAGVLADRTDRAITVELPGGELRCEWREADNRVTMTGPAVEVFTGHWPADRRR